MVISRPRGGPRASMGRAAAPGSAGIPRQAPPRARRGSGCLPSALRGRCCAVMERASFVVNVWWYPVVLFMYASVAKGEAGRVIPGG